MLVRAARRARRTLLRASGVPLAALLERLARRSQTRVGIALVYHRVGDPAGDLRRELVPALGTRLFTRQVRYLRSRYALVTASDLLCAAAARTTGSPFPLALTLDDDLHSHLTVAGPALRRHGATATFFLTGASLDERHTFWWEHLQTVVDHGLELPAEIRAEAGGATSIHELGRAIEALPPAGRARVDAALEALAGPGCGDEGLRRDDVADLSSQGFEIGFHTIRHDRLTTLDDDSLARALEDGRRDLEAASRRPVTSIAYPHGAGDDRVARAAERAAFRTGFTGQPEAVRPGSDPLLLGRVSPSYTSLGELAFDIAWMLFRSSR